MCDSEQYQRGSIVVGAFGVRQYSKIASHSVTVPVVQCEEAWTGVCLCQSQSLQRNHVRLRAGKAAGANWLATWIPKSLLRGRKHNFDQVHCHKR